MIVPKVCVRGVRDYEFKCCCFFGDDSGSMLNKVFVIFLLDKHIVRLQIKNEKERHHAICNTFREEKKKFRVYKN